MRRVLTVTLLALCVATLLPTEARAQGGLLEKIQTEGKLKVGVAEYAPWVMRDAQGEWIGFEIDVANRLAADLGVEVEFVPTSWGDIIHDLLEGRYDIIISGLSVTPARALEVEYSEIYNTSGISLVANRAGMGDRRNKADFNQAGTTIGVVSGTTAAGIVEREFPRAELREFESPEAMYAAVHGGDVVAIVGSSPGPELAVAGAGDVLAIPFDEPLATRGEAFAIRPGDARFLDYLDAWVTYERLDGWLDHRRAYWFHSSDWLDQL